LVLKIGSSGLVIWISKSPRWFFGLGLKIKLPVAPQNQQREVGVVYVSRYSGLLRLEVSWVMIFQSGLKTGLAEMTGGARCIITEVASR
jgi:hypothetical protein